MDSKKAFSWTLFLALGWGAVFAHAQSAPGEEAYSGRPLDPAKPVAVRFVIPQGDAILPENEADVFVQADNYTLGPGGNRLAVLLDNRPPILLSDLVAPAVFKNLSEGGHTLRLLAVKPDGMALPNPEAEAMVHFFVRHRDFQNYINPEAPYLTVNLPLTGVVTADGDDRVWFDFKVHNAALAKDGYRVRYKVNQTEAFQYEDKPVYWEGLKPGRYILTADLLDASLQPVPGIFNQVIRSFEVQAPVRAIPVGPLPLPGQPAAPTPEARD